MPSTSVISSSIILDRKRIDQALEDDFKAWLASLQSGNLSRELEAFDALKNDFQISSQRQRGESAIDPRSLLEPQNEQVA